MKKTLSEDLRERGTWQPMTRRREPGGGCAVLQGVVRDGEEAFGAAREDRSLDALASVLGEEGKAVAGAR